MRAKKMNGLVGGIHSSFLSCEKDAEEIIKKLFVESNPYSEDLKRLLVINTPDVLDAPNKPEYLAKMKEVTVAELSKRGYVRQKPKIKFGENEEVKSYIRISFGNFSPNAENSLYRDCIVMIDIICHTDYWELGDYRLRPYKIAGIVDGILNGCRLSGIGTLDFIGGDELILDEELSGFCLMYSAIHGNDDRIEEEEALL